MENATATVSDQTSHAQAGSGRRAAPPAAAVSSRELLVDLAGVPRGGLGAALEASLRRAIRDGRLRPGARLPSTRALAADLGLSRSVVVGAYEQLAAEGYLTTRPGAAALVSELGRRATPGERQPGTASRWPGVPAGPATANGRWDVDFRPGSPELSRLPRAELERAVRRALATLTDAELGYGDSRGLPRLREALADYLGRVRGAVADPADIVVVNGFAQGLVVVGKLLRQRGAAAVAVEDPGSTHTRTHVEAQGLGTVPLPVDAEGADIDAVPPGRRDTLGAALVTPAHQFPTGAVLAPARRHRLLAWAEERDALVIEDDYDAEYRYDHHPVGALQGMAPQRVVLGGTTSKTLAPGLRLGWLVVPSALAPDAAAHKLHLDLMTPVLEQAALSELIASGQYERHVRRSRARYRRRRDLLVDLLAEHLPEATVTGTSAGLHLLVEVPPEVDERAAVAEADHRGVGVVGVGEHRDGPGPPGFVLGYGHLSDAQVWRGVLGLAAAVRAAMS